MKRNLIVGIIALISMVNCVQGLAVLTAKELAQELQITVEKAKRITNQMNIEDKNFTTLSRIEYYDVVTKLIREFDLKIGCEIGVCFGRHSEVILDTTAVQKLYSIDTFKFEHLNWLNFDDPIYGDALYLRVKKLLSNWGSRSELIRNDSVSASLLFKDLSLDFVFIDGDHTYEGVCADLNSWYHKVRDGGLVIGDDYNDIRFPGVTQGVNEFFARKGLEVHVDGKRKRLWWIQKPIK